MKRLVYSLCMALLCLAFAGGALAQVNPTGTLTGTVLDSQGAAVVGANVTVTDQATNSATNTQTGADGHFSVPNLNSGNYSVAVSMAGFKKAVYRDIKILSGQTYDLAAKMEVGEVVNTVTVEAGQEVVQTADTEINNTVTGRTIQQLPFTSRDTLDLAVLDPNTQSDGRPRNSTVAGLPKGALNITFDGINVQDQELKSGDGFYTYIRPRVDDVEEFTMTTAANNAQESGEGAVQIGFVSKRGTNDWHGGIWEYNRNTDFNANYYFNNLAGTPRQVEDLNEYGGKFGGPIWKNKLWFFVDVDNYAFPQSLSVQPSILTPQAAAGVYTYEPVDSNGNFLAPTAGQLATTPWITCNNAAQTCSANLLQMAAANGNPSIVDTQMHTYLTAIESAASAPGVGILPNNLYSETLSFLDKGTNARHFPDARIDWDITPKNHLELDEHYSTWFGTPDFLNGAEATLPVAPFNTNQGGQNGWRSLTVAAWRLTIGNSMSNEVRAGLEDGPTGFFIGENLNIYPTVTTNLGSTPVVPTLFNGLVSEPFLTGLPSARNYALGQVNDTLSWTKGTHNLAFGADFSYNHANGFNNLNSTNAGSITLGLDQNAPSAGMFTGLNLPNIGASDLGNTEQLYGSLLGFITNYSASVAVNPKTQQYQTGLNQLTALRQFEMGVFATDSWHIRPSVTINYGLRWEYSGPVWDANNDFFMVQGGYNAIFGPSGAGNLFKPGTMTGTGTVYLSDQGNSWYNRDLHDFAPSIGVAWQPGFENSFLQRVFGGTGRTVIRAGYAIAYTREGIANWESLADGNPGIVANQAANSSSQFAPQSATLAAGNITGVVQNPASFQSSFTVPFDQGSPAANIIDPNLRTPMVQSYSIGIQREIGNNMALEIRYQGNHGTRLWRQYNVNEVNIFENGFLAEFNNAKHNMSVCQANAGACVAAQTTAGVTSPTVNSFANWGLTGQQNLPIMTGAFTGSANAVPAQGVSCNNQCSPFFTNGTLVSDLNNGLAGSFANSVASSGTLYPNLLTAGFPSNFFVVNPSNEFGGDFLLDNGGASHYNALVVDFRQRISHGLLFDFAYTYSHSLSNEPFSADQGSTSQTVQFNNYFTLRDPGLSWSEAPYDNRHQFKSQVIYDLPFGPGHRLTTSSGAFNRILGGWQIALLTRASAGRPTYIEGGLGGTVNQYDGGLTLNGITVNQIQADTGVTHAPGKVFWMPSSLIASSGRANASFLSPCTTAGSFCQDFIDITGPRFFRADWSLSKHTKITERVELELRVDLLNAFNNPDFFYGGSSSASPATKTLQSTTFGRITSAYQDVSTTDDPGGRILQLVGRINF